MSVIYPFAAGVARRDHAKRRKEPPPGVLRRKAWPLRHRLRGVIIGGVAGAGLCLSAVFFALAGSDPVGEIRLSVGVPEGVVIAFKAKNVRRAAK